MHSISHTLKSLAAMPHLVLGGHPRERAGDGLLVSHDVQLIGEHPISVVSPAFGMGEPIPARYTADGEGLSPPLRWSRPPEGTRSLVLFCEDPDAPTPQPFLHWLAYDISPNIDGLPEGLTGDSPAVLNGGQVGRNSMLRAAWAGCAPPRGDSPHHYHFQLFALDRILLLGPHAGRGAVLHAMKHRALGFGELVGTYQR